MILYVDELGLNFIPWIIIVHATTKLVYERFLNSNYSDQPVQTRSLIIAFAGRNALYGRGRINLGFSRQDLV